MSQEQTATSESVPAQAQPPRPDLAGQEPLQVDNDLEDDAGYAASEDGSLLSSLNSSIFHYKYENGRRYHAFREGAYLVPNDVEEQDRMDLAHHIYGLLLGGELHLAPLGDNPQRVLDLGTGTGIWAMDFAESDSSTKALKENRS